MFFNKIKKFMFKEKEKEKEKEILLGVLNNSSWLLFDKISRLGLGLIVGAWVARYLGPNEYGKLAFILAYIAIFQAISLLGLDNIVVRDISKYKNKIGGIVGTTIFMRMSSGILLWSIAVIFIGYKNGFLSETTILTGLCGAGIIFQATDVIDLWFQSQSQSKRTVVVKLSAYLLSNCLKVFLILNHYPIVYFAIVTAIEALLCSIGLFFAYKKYPVENIHVSMNIAKRLIRESWPYVFSSLSIIIYMRIDQIMLGNYLGDKAVGIYAAIMPIATLWSFVPMTISTSLAPFIARKRNQDINDYNNWIKKIFILYSGMGWIISILLYFAAPLIVPLLFGNAYSDGVKLLQILAINNLFINLGLAQSIWIVNEGKGKLALYKTIVGAIFCIISNLLLIPQFGMIGAALSSVFSQIISTVLINIILERKIFIIQIKSIFFIK
jgi:PST family polysaccharide transporter